MRIRLKNGTGDTVKDAGIKCRFCGSKKHSKEGFTKTLKRGKIQKYKCLRCGKHFTPANKYFRMRNNPLLIKKVIQTEGALRAVERKMLVGFHT